MSEQERSTEVHYELELKELRIRGQIDSRWVERFDGLTMTLDDSNNTLLAGPVVDQAALYGLMKSVRDLGMPLLSVICIRPGYAETTVGVE